MTTKSWSVHVEASGVALDDQLADQLMETLTRTAAAGRIGEGITVTCNPQLPAVGASLVIETGDVREAVAVAWEAVRHALDAAGVDAEIDTIEVTSDRRETDQPQIPDLVGVSEIARMMEPPVSPQRVHELTRRPDFPQPVVRISAGKVFLRAEVEQWLRTWPRRRTGRPRKTLD